MPAIYRTAAYDLGGYIILEVASLTPPQQRDADMLKLTADAFGLGPVVEIACDRTTACRCCGCTEDHACEGGCAWFDDGRSHGLADIGDLCTACHAKGLR